MSKFRLLFIVSLFLSLNATVFSSDVNIRKLFGEQNLFGKLRFIAALVTENHKFLPDNFFEQKAESKIVAEPVRSITPGLNNKVDIAPVLTGFGALLLEVESKKPVISELPAFVKPLEHKRVSAIKKEFRRFGV